VNFPRQIKALLHAGLADRDARDAGHITLFKSAVLADVLTQRLKKQCAPKTHLGNERLAKFLHWNRHDVFR
jgi:hypothetical protein